MRLVLSFAILHVIVVVRTRTVVISISIIVPKRRDESPHNLSQTSFPLVSFKNQQSTRKEEEKEGEKTLILRGRFLCWENKTTERYKTTWKKSAHIIIRLPEQAERFEKEKRRRKREKKSWRARETKKKYLGFTKFRPCTKPPIIALPRPHCIYRTFLLSKRTRKSARTKNAVRVIRNRV